MKRRLFFIASLVLSFSILSGCGPTTGSTSSGSSSSTSALSVPDGIIISEREITWNEVESAEGYRVVINENTPVSVYVNHYALPDEYVGEISVSVQAFNEGNMSAYSQYQALTAYLALAVPSNFRQEGTSVLWDAVDHAEGYVVKVGSVENLTVHTSFTVASANPVSVQVKAFAPEIGYYLDSGYSSSITYRLTLSAPGNIQYSEGVLSWNSVNNATGYEILVNDTPFTSTSTSVTVGYDFVGSNLIKVRATDSTNTYFDSPWAEKTVSVGALDLSVPGNIEIDENVLSFDEVAHATGYDIYVNGELYASVTANTYEIPSAVLELESVYIQVKAVSAVHNPSPLSDKVYLKYQEINTEAGLRAMETDGAYILTADIALTASWTPINFQGLLYGQNHTVSGVIIEEDLPKAGFFSSLTDAEVTGLNIEGEISVTMTSANPSIGGLAGYIFNSEVTDVDVDMEINVISSNGIAAVGGIAGTAENSDLLQTHFTGEIITLNAVTGGLIGKSLNGDYEVTVRQSSATGNISVSGGEQAYAGGFIGQLTNNSMLITTSRFEGNVTGSHYVGGFVGYMGSGRIENSYSRGTVTATSGTLVIAGGFAGRIEGYNNRIAYSLAMTLVIVPEGSDIKAGSFSGFAPGGSFGGNIHEACYYDSTISTRDRIGNPTGRGDGITARTSVELLQLTNYNADIWDFTHEWPMLKWELN